MKNRYTTIISIALLLSLNTAMAAERDGERPPPRPEFSVLDANSDGQIEWEEFASQEVPMGTTEEAFQRMDTDQDGFVSAQEYADHKPPRRQRN